MVKIEIDYDKKVIKWGDLYTQEYFQKGLDWKYVSKNLGFTYGLRSNTYQKKNSGKIVYSPGSGNKKQNQKLTKLLGISPKKFAYMLKGAQYTLWIKGKEELISKLCNVRGHWSSEKISLLNQNWEIVQQYKNDGLDHLIPLGMYTGKSTKELKQEFGKSLWKSICNNTFYRNKLICLQFRPGDPYKFKDLINFYNKIPSSIFRCLSGEIYFQNSFLWGCDVLKKKRLLLKCKNYLYDYHNIYSDTENMSKKLSEGFNQNWSFKRMNEMHDKYSLMIQTKQYPDTFISCLEGIKLKKYSTMGFTAKLLSTHLQIAMQGKSQGHCVGSYIDSVKNGNYLVYDIQKDNETVSTLGISIHKTGEKIFKETESINTILFIGERPVPKDFPCVWGYKKEYRFSQHYAKYNKPISYDEELFTKQLINELNKDEI